MLTPIKITELEVGTGSDLAGGNIVAATTDYGALAKENTLKFTFDQVVQQGILSITRIDHLTSLSVSNSIKVGGKEVLRDLKLGTQKTKGSNASVSMRTFQGSSYLDFVFAEGTPGPQGEIGTIGPRGETGKTGADSIVEGPKGEIGPQGETGKTGADSVVEGPKGKTGDTGSDPTIQITNVVTGFPDDPASVINVGTAQDARFEFVIPKGDKGDPGVDALTPTYSYDVATKTLTITNV